MSDDSFREIADFAPAILWVTDPSGACTYLSRQWYEYTGQSEAEGLGLGWTAAVHPEDAGRSSEIFLHANEQREPFRLDYRLRRHDGVYRWAVDVGRPRFAADGHFRGYVGSVLDITERREVEDALRLSEARYRRLIETTQEGVWIVDTQNRTEYVNHRMAEMLGYTPEEMMRRSPLAFVADAVELRDAERELERRRQGTIGLYERRFRHRDGSEICTLINANPWRDEDGNYVGSLAMITDITARKELERQLLQSQKMEAVGRLAGGLAHDFNNLLTAIAGHARVVIDELDSGSPLRADLVEVERAVERASTLTRQLLTFSRQETRRPVVMDLNAAILDFERMLARTIGSDILMDVQLDESLPPIRADRVQVEQVLLNLANNARDAMPRGGTLSIRTRRVPAGDAESPDAEAGAPDVVSLTIADTGGGMDKAARQRAFEPFFTTKEPGEGTGLGLATVHGIVEQSGGSIAIETERGKGTSFTIRLPASDASVETGSEQPGVSPPRGHERILVVEDDNAVRHLAVRVLERQGYQVLEAATADEALGILRDGGEIDLLLTDMVLPGWSGRDLADHVARSRSGLKVTFMSGYSPDDRLRPVAGDDSIPFIQKPFTPGELATAVRDVLDSARSL